MAPFGYVSAALFGSVLLLPAAAGAQTADAGPTAPAARGLVGTPRQVSRTAPSAGVRPASKADPALPVAKPQALPKPTAAELAEKRKLDHDLKICIGC